MTKSTPNRNPAEKHLFLTSFPLTSPTLPFPPSPPQPNFFSSSFFKLGSPLSPEPEALLPILEGRMRVCKGEYLHQGTAFEPFLFLTSKVGFQIIKSPFLFLRSFKLGVKGRGAGRGSGSAPRSCRGLASPGKANLN